MRRLTSSFVLAAATTLAVAGCSSDEEAAAPAAASSSAATSSGAAAPSSATGAEEVSPELATWASGFCTAAAPLAEVAATATQPPTGDLTDPNAAKTYIVDLYGALSTAFADTATAVGDLEDPPVDDADGFTETAAQAFGEAGTTLQGLADEASAVDPTDPAALGAIAEGLGGTGDPLAAAFSELEAQTPPSVETALSQVPECAALGG